MARSLRDREFVCSGTIETTRSQGSADTLGATGTMDQRRPAQLHRSRYPVVHNHIRRAAVATGPRATGSTVATRATVATLAHRETCVTRVTGATFATESTQAPGAAVAPFATRATRGRHELAVI